MTRVRDLVVLIVAIGLVGCAATRERSVEIAVREVSRRKLPLPANYTVRVQEGFSIPEFARSSKLWCIDLSVPGRKQPLYSVWVVQHNGIITDFTDHRRDRAVPSEI